jgi:hypothetical protein
MWFTNNNSFLLHYLYFMEHVALIIYYKSIMVGSYGLPPMVLADWTGRKEVWKNYFCNSVTALQAIMNII